MVNCTFIHNTKYSIQIIDRYSLYVIKHYFLIKNFGLPCTLCHIIRVTEKQAIRLLVFFQIRSVL